MVRDVPAPSMSEAQGWREHFEILNQRVNGKPLAYLDSAATTQKPAAVLDAMEHYYRHDNANVHRGIHALSQRATDLFEASRRTVQRFIGARSEKETIFTKGCTEAINLVAGSWGKANLKAGDVVLLSSMEHHANIIPWQIACQETGATIQPIPITDRGELDWPAFEPMLTDRVKLVGVKHVCNALGSIQPVQEIVEAAHRVGARVLLDGAQALAHQKVNVAELDVDFYAVSGHKVYGPTGIGALFAKQDLLEAMPPYQSGGDMIRTVTFEQTTYNGLPNKFEPGTPNIAGVIGFAAALEFVDAIGLDSITAHESALLDYATARLGEVPGTRLYGTADRKAAILSFTMDCAHPHDIGTVLDQEGVAIRAGHHCCMPLMQRLGVISTARASFAMYNSHEDVDQLIGGLLKVREIFA